MLSKLLTVVHKNIAGKWTLEFSENWQLLDLHVCAYGGFSSIKHYVWVFVWRKGYLVCMDRGKDGQIDRRIARP